MRVTPFLGPQVAIDTYFCSINQAKARMMSMFL
jgi:hypothetical protein